MIENGIIITKNKNGRLTPTPQNVSCASAAKDLSAREARARWF